MSTEQQQRFQELKRLAEEAHESVARIQHLADESFDTVNVDDPDQGSDLQRIQQYAGAAVSVLKKLDETAKHARAFGAQQHNEHKQ